MKTQILLFSFLCIIVWHLQAQHLQQNTMFNSRSERIGSYFNPSHSEFKSDRIIVPQKSNLFNPLNYEWRWDTLMCYNTTPGSDPFQRISRTYNSLGEAQTCLYERRQGSLAWENYAREADTYDSAGNWVTQFQERWKNNEWLSFQHQEMVYNAAGDMGDWKRTMWDSMAWANMWHYYWHFGSNGLNDTCIYQTGQGSLWVNVYRWIPTYDSTGVLNSFITQTWTNNDWVVTGLEFYAYDSNGHCLTILNQIWQNSSWVNISLATGTYDTSGNCVTTLHQQWQSGGWENSDSSTYTYNADGDKVTDLFQMWTSGVWENSSLQFYTYDSSNNMLSYTHQNWMNSTWRNAQKQKYTYDQSGNSLTGEALWWYQGIWQPDPLGSPSVFVDHQYDGIDLMDVYRYAAVIDSIQVLIKPAGSIPQVTMYPNPAHSLVYVTVHGPFADQKGSLTFYDLRGQLVLTKHIANETTGIDIGNLKPGVYFVRFSDNRMTRVLKFIKN